jgi:hypothetical protein
LPVASGILAAGGALGLAEDEQAAEFIESGSDVGAAIETLDALAGYKIGPLYDAAMDLLGAASERGYALGLAVGLRLARLMEESPCS